MPPDSTDKVNSRLIRPGENVREAAIRNAIDAVYGERDNGGTMHSAGEVAAAVVLDVVVEALRSNGGDVPVNWQEAAKLIDNGTLDV